jgi:hypothetical protein
LNIIYSQAKFSHLAGNAPLWVEFLLHSSLSKILLAEFAEVQETESETLEEWKASVPDPIKFCDIYIEFRNLFFDNALSSFTKNWKDNVTNMIDAFLYKEGLSLYSLGDDYGMIAKHIHITAKKINIIRHKKEQ